ncbi:hypothetical protein [Xanthomonas citri]|nr:hypothetical protein [Xanthomonas citri]QTF14273.1 hypothetical protein XcfCFBP6991P_24445 [Xanthomonas citri pv. phaseoli var. fuscans]
MLAQRHYNVCGKQWNREAATTPAGPVLEIRVGRFHFGVERASRFNQ